MTRKLIQQAVYCPEQDCYYKSGHTHDFVTIELSDKKSVFLDGGCSYVRRGGDLELFSNGRLLDWSLYEDDPFEVVADKFLWGTYGPGGKGPFRWKLLKDCDLDHLEAILATQHHIRGKLVEKIVKYWVDKKKGEGLSLKI